MEADRLKWNTKHKDAPYPDAPSQTLVDFLPFAKKGRALDIACGMGRNSKYMRDNGFVVDAVDLSDYAISVLAGKPNINAQNVDMDSFKPEADSYELIVNIHFLQRRLFPYIKEALKPSGMVIYETFLEHPETPLQSFSNRDHLLRSQELLHGFLGLSIMHYSER